MCWMLLLWLMLVVRFILMGLDGFWYVIGLSCLIRFCLEESEIMYSKLVFGCEEVVCVFGVVCEEV